MTRTPKTILACLLALSAAGCTTVGEDDLPDVDTDPDLGVAQLGCLSPGCQENGRALLSAVLDVDGYLSFPFVGQVGGVDVPLKLTASGLRRLNGNSLPSALILTADNGAEVTILSVQTPPGEPGPQYELSYTDGTSAVNPCVHGTAIVIDGDFDEVAHHDEDSVGPAADRRFSFACKDEGTAYKCVDLGYPPGSDPDLVPWRAHQICTRALRADYCKDGRSHTLNETHIAIWDDYPNLGFPPAPTFTSLRQWPPPPGVFKFESVWPEGEEDPLTCLGKDRWHALEPGALDSCALAPPDPRTTPGAQFCDEAGNDIIPPNSFVLGSRYTDLLLEEWEHAQGDVAVSVTGYYDGGEGNVPEKRPFGNAPGYSHVKTLGTLLRSLPGSIDKHEVMHVYTYSDGTDHVLAGSGASAWLPSFPIVSTTWEGMVFVDQPDFPPTAALHAYESASGDHYNGTKKANTADIDHGRIGYILVPAN